MKKIYLILLSCLFIMDAFSQKVTMNEEKILIDKKPTNAWVAVINENIDLVRKSFVRFAKDKYDAKAKKKNKRTLLIEQANLPTISDKQGDLWVAFYPENNTIKMGIAYSLGYDIAINSEEYPTEMSNLKSFFREFVVYYKSEYFNTLIAEDQKRIKELSAELRKNQKEFKSLTRSISKVEKTILKETDETVKFELNNQNIESKANIQAKHEIMLNLKEEITKVSSSLKTIKSSLKKLETEAFEDEVLD